MNEREAERLRGMLAEFESFRVIRNSVANLLGEFDSREDCMGFTFTSTAITLYGADFKPGSVQRERIRTRFLAAAAKILREELEVIDRHIALMDANPAFATPAKPSKAKKPTRKLTEGLKRADAAKLGKAWDKKPAKEKSHGS